MGQLFPDAALDAAVAPLAPGHSTPRTSPGCPAASTTRSDGQVVARIFPQTLADRMLFMGVTGEVWMQPGVTRDDVLARQAFTYRDKGHPGQVTLVLGAGNAAPMLPDDVLHQLFIADHVVLLKLNPVNAYLGPLLEEALQPLVQRGFLRMVAGGAVEGVYLCAHPAVDAIHLTGSDKTFETIVFGSGAGGPAAQGRAPSTAGQTRNRRVGQRHADHRRSRAVEARATCASRRCTWRPGWCSTPAATASASG